MATVKIRGHGFENGRTWAKNTVTVRFDKEGFADVDVADLPKLDLHLHREFEIVDSTIESVEAVEPAADVDEDVDDEPVVGV